MAKKKAAFPPGTVIRHTAKWLRSTGQVTRGSINGVVLGAREGFNLVAWSEGYTSGVAVANIEKTRKQLPPAEAKAIVSSEIKRLGKTYGGGEYSAEDIQSIKKSYGIGADAANPRRGRKNRHEMSLWDEVYFHPHFEVDRRKMLRSYVRKHGRAKTQRELAEILNLPHLKAHHSKLRGDLAYLKRKKNPAVKRKANPGPTSAQQEVMRKYMRGT